MFVIMIHVEHNLSCQIPLFLKRELTFNSAGDVSQFELKTSLRNWVIRNPLQKSIINGPFLSYYNRIKMT